MIMIFFSGFGMKHSCVLQRVIIFFVFLFVPTHYHNVYWVMIFFTELLVQGEAFALIFFHLKRTWARVSLQARGLRASPGAAPAMALSPPQRWESWGGAPAAREYLSLQ